MNSSSSTLQVRKEMRKAPHQQHRLSVRSITIEKFRERFSLLFFAPFDFLLLRAQGEIVNKIMISLMEIYYPSNLVLGSGISRMMLLLWPQNQKNERVRRGEEEGNPLNLFRIILLLRWEVSETHYYEIFNRIRHNSSEGALVNVGSDVMRAPHNGDVP